MKELKKMIIKDCYECPFHADTYEVSHKEVDDGSSFCTYYEAQIGGEMGDDSMFDDEGEKAKDFPDFCQVRKVTIEGGIKEAKIGRNKHERTRYIDG